MATLVRYVLDFTQRPLHFCMNRRAVVAETSTCLTFKMKLKRKCIHFESLSQFRRHAKQEPLSIQRDAQLKPVESVW